MGIDSLSPGAALVPNFKPHPFSTVHESKPFRLCKAAEHLPLLHTLAVPNFAQKVTSIFNV